MKNRRGERGLRKKSDGDGTPLQLCTEYIKPGQIIDLVCFIAIEDLENHWPVVQLPRMLFV